MDTDGYVGKKTPLEIVRWMLTFVDAQKRMCSKNVSGLVPRPELAGSWEMWNQCQMWLREKAQEAESMPGPADPQKNA